MSKTRPHLRSCKLNQDQITISGHNHHSKIILTDHRQAITEGLLETNGGQLRLWSQTYLLRTRFTRVLFYQHEKILKPFWCSNGARSTMIYTQQMSMWKYCCQKASSINCTFTSRDYICTENRVVTIDRYLSCISTNLSTIYLHEATQSITPTRTQ